MISSNPEKIKVSVIIAMHNAQEHITRTIDSLLVQSLQETEIIVVDDNSSDKSMEAVQQYRSLANVYLYNSEKNIGPGFCRNIGLSHAHGEYIAFVDSDDFVDSKFLSALYALAEGNSADIAVCGYDKVTENDFLRSYLPSPGLHKGGKGLIDKLNSIEFVVWNKIYKRSFLQKYNICFELPCYGEDWLFSFKAMYMTDKYVCTGRSLYFYYQHYNSATHKLALQKVFSNIYEFFILLDKFVCAQNISEEGKLVIENNFFFAAASCYLLQLYGNASAKQRLFIRDNILSEQFGQGGVHFKILLDAFFTLYNYSAQSLRCDKQTDNNPLKTLADKINLI